MKVLIVLIFIRIAMPLVGFAISVLPAFGINRPTKPAQYIRD